MSNIGGNLLWNRRRLTIPADPNGINIDTGITQVNRAFQDPTLGAEQATPPPIGTGPASRVMVQVLPPTDAWAGLLIGEPYFDTDTNTVHVVFTNLNEQAAEINVLFWDPSTLCGPGQADTYNEPNIQ